MDYTISKIDFLRFGINTAKARLNSNEDLEKAINLSEQDQIDFLIVRIPTDQLSTVQALLLRGAILTDTLIYYEKKAIEPFRDCLLPGYAMRYADSSDAAKVEKVAQVAFEDYFGHYQADPRLDKRDCNLAYSSWAFKSCIDSGFTEDVILIEKGKDIAAFATVKRIEATSFEGVLFAVSPKYRQRGLHKALMKLALNWGAQKRMSRMISSTQITNLPVQKNWCRLGFEPAESYYTLHYWTT